MNIGNYLRAQQIGSPMQRVIISHRVFFDCLFIYIPEKCLQIPCIFHMWSLHSCQPKGVISLRYFYWQWYCWQQKVIANKNLTQLLIFLQHKIHRHLHLFCCWIFDWQRLVETYWEPLSSISKYQYLKISATILNRHFPFKIQIKFCNKLLYIENIPVLANLLTF